MVSSLSYLLKIIKYSVSLVLLATLLQGSSCLWFCDTGSEITLSETQELVGISSSSRAQVEADIDEFYDWLWSFEHRTAAFGGGGARQSGEYRTQGTWNDPISPPDSYGVNFFARYPSEQDRFFTMDLATSSNLKGYYEGKSGDARLMEPWLALCSLPEGHPLLTMLTYPNESVSEPSDMHQFRTQGSILIMISKGMIRKVDQPDLCVTIRTNQVPNDMYCYDDYYEWKFNLLRIPGEQITALMNDLAAQGIVYEYPDEPIY